MASIETDDNQNGTTTVRVRDQHGDDTVNVVVSQDGQTVAVVAAGGRALGIDLLTPGAAQLRSVEAGLGTAARLGRDNAADELARDFAALADQFLDRLPDGTRNGRPINSYAAGFAIREVLRKHGLLRERAAS